MTFKVLLLSQELLMTPWTVNYTDIWFHYDVAITSSEYQLIRQILHKHCRLTHSIRNRKEKKWRGIYARSVKTHVTAHALLVLQIVCAFPVCRYQRYDRWEMRIITDWSAVRSGLYTEQRKLREARDIRFWGHLI
jgi:hypothetical protein